MLTQCLVAIFNKLATVNKNMVSSGRKDAALNPGEELILQSLRESLEGSKPIPPKSLDLVARIVTAWPYSDRLAGLDVLRCMAKYHDVAQYKSDSHGSLIDLAMASSLPASEPPGENAVMMGVRTIANVFASADGRSLVSTQVNTILSFLERVTGVQGSDAIGKFNRNVLIAVSTVALNLSVLVAREKLLASQDRRRLVAILGAILSQQSDSEVLYRSLVALGTVLSVSPESATGLDINAWVTTASERGAEDRVRQIARECAQVLSR